MTDGDIKCREDFRQWLDENHSTAKECRLRLKRGRPEGEGHFWYIDAVEEALCFGWIDCTTGKDGMRKFAPRRPGSHWTELNKARCERLIRLGKMTQAGLEAYSRAGEFVMDTEIEKALRDGNAWDGFMGFPELYRKIRTSNTAFYRKLNPDAYKRKLEKLIDESSRGIMSGQWNDWGRLP